ncbi:MAG: PDZ domain-containing protein [marine benthic group bacterium]|nr:PDZ domain-containing protein [Gemmatimonadota bacterium]
MQIGRWRWMAAALGTAALVTATARCGSAQEQAPEPDEEKQAVVAKRAAPFVVRGGMGGGSYLGVYITEVDAEDVERLDLDRERGALIEKVTEDGPAQEAGLLEDDVILEWNGASVESAAQLQRLVRETPAGREVELKLVRDGRNRDVRVTIGERESLVRSFSFRGPAPEHMEKLQERLRSGGERFQFRAPGLERGVFAFMGGGRLGVGIQSIGDQLGEYFGLSGRTGVLVTSVKEDFPAASAGLRAGDVILTLDGAAIDGTGDLARKIREADEGPLRIGILRDRQERTVTVELPEAPEFEWKEAPDGAAWSVPEAIEGAMMLVPEILEEIEIPDLEIETWTVPEGDVRVEWHGQETVST